MTPIPPRFLAPERFAALRAALLDAGYTEPALCSRLSIPSLSHLQPPGQGRPAEDLASAPSLLTHLFLDRAPAPLDTAGARLGPLFDLLVEFGLLRPHPFDLATVLSTVMLYPSHGLLLASDRDWEPESGPGVLPLPDAVFLSITPNTYAFLHSLPLTPCDSFLDLCSGNGAAALIAAPHSASVFSCDIAPRCTLFTRWNAALNAVSNLTAASGDLYAPVSGLSFHRIAAHPPYCPAVQDQFVFRDAGPDGERITRAIIQGLPSALAPGGQCFITATLTDHPATPPEHRVRSLLGPHAPDFDVLVALRRRIAAAEVLDSPSDGPFQSLRPGIEAARASGIEGFLYCAIVLQRRSSPRPVFTLARTLPNPSGNSLEWLMRWEALRLSPGYSRLLLDAHLTVNPNVRLNVVSAFRNRLWSPLSSKLVSSQPFPAEIDCPPWLDAALRLTDGRRPAREIFSLLKANGAAPAHAPESEFLRLLEMLVSSGVLEIPSLPLPPPESQVEG